jgi:hypothetical protein
MKTALFTMLSILSLARISFSQNAILDQKIDLVLYDKTIYQSLKIIASTADVSFSYNSKALKKEKKKISKSFEQTPLTIVLTYILEGTKYRFKEVAGQITLYTMETELGSTYSLSGFLVDKASKEKLIGARVYVPSLDITCHSNAYGYYFIEIPAGNFYIEIGYIGMKTIRNRVDMSANTIRDFELEQDTILLKEVSVSDQEKNKHQLESEVEIGLEKIILDPKLLELIPSSNGLPDVTKYIQNIAGIQPRQDGSSAFQVRGLSNGNNLILLDEIPIYHPNHLLGIHSIINSNAVKSVNIYKDYLPANFGLRNSSVLQIYTKEGDMNKFRISGGLGVGIPNLNIEGPIIKNKASFYLSARQSFNALGSIGILFPSDLPDPNFFDLTLKLNYKINYKNRVFLTGYFGNDRISSVGTPITNFIKSSLNNFTTTEYDIKWGNNALSFRWNKIISEKLFRNTTIINSVFKYNSFQDNKFKQQIITSQIKNDYTYFLSNRTKVIFGASVLNTRTNSNDNNTEKVFLNRNSYETAFYFSLNHKISKKLTLNTGVRLPFYHHIGMQDTTAYLLPDFSTATVVYAKNKFYNFKSSLDPRLLLSYQLNPKNSVQISANIATQFTHIINYNTKVLPVQIWINPSNYLKPQRNYQASVGWHTKVRSMAFSSIFYTRYINNVLDFSNTNFSNNLGIESRLLSGSMKSKGAELSLQYQKTKKYSAKLTYTYSQSLQTIAGINNGKPYTPDYSRNHFLSFSQYFIKSEKWEFGFNFVYHSKSAISLPVAKTIVDGVQIPIYGEDKNQFFLPQHDRLDISARRKLGIKQQKNFGHLMFTFANAYLSQNISNAYPQSAANGTVFFVKQNFIPTRIFIYYFISF